MDALFFFRHSVHGDFEIRQTLRGIARYMPWIRKVWIFGDRPVFLTDDTSLVEHVPHEYVARVGDFRTPVTNFFLMYYLSSLIPEMDDEYVWFCDDFFVIGPVTIEEARKDRYIVDMDRATRATGLWNESLWRTYDFLKRLGYTRYNFEIHAPTYFTKRRVLEAYCDLKDFVTEDRWYGLLGPTAILNHAVSSGDCDLIQRDREGKWVGYYRIAPSYDELLVKVKGKSYLNCDDGSLSADVRRYLSEVLPEPCKYEVAVPPAPPAMQLTVDTDFRAFPPILLADRNQLGRYLNSQGLTGVGALVSVGTLDFAKMLLTEWQGYHLHCVSANRTPGATPEEAASSKLLDSLTAFEGRWTIHELQATWRPQQLDGSLVDFVYFDRFRSAETLVSALNEWLPRVRPGGLVLGNNYVDCLTPAGFYDIKSAVDDFAAGRNLQLHCTGEALWRTWVLSIPPT